MFAFLKELLEQHGSSILAAQILNAPIKLLVRVWDLLVGEDRR